MNGVLPLGRVDIFLIVFIPEMDLGMGMASRCWMLGEEISLSCVADKCQDNYMVCAEP